MNGCDAMEGQATDRRLTVRTQQTGQGSVEVTVSDQGAGIPWRISTACSIRS